MTYNNMGEYAETFGKEISASGSITTLHMNHNNIEAQAKAFAKAIACMPVLQCSGGGEEFDELLFEARFAYNMQEQLKNYMPLTLAETVIDYLGDNKHEMIDYLGNWTNYSDMSEVISLNMLIKELNDM